MKGPARWASENQNSIRGRLEPTGTENSGATAGFGLARGKPSLRRLVIGFPARPWCLWPLLALLRPLWEPMGGTFGGFGGPYWASSLGDARTAVLAISFLMGCGSREFALY